MGLRARRRRRLGQTESQEDIEGGTPRPSVDGLDNCLKHMEAQSQGFNNAWKTALYVVSALSLVHKLFQLLTFYNSALHIAAGFQITSILSLIVTVNYIGTNKHFWITATLAALHVIAWLGFHRFVPRDQHTDEVFPLCTVLFCVAWCSMNFISSTEGSHTKTLVTELKRGMSKSLE